MLLRLEKGIHMDFQSMYNNLVSIAKESKSGKLSSSEVNEKYLFACEQTDKEKLFAKLEESGYITRTTQCDSILARAIKRIIDECLLQDLMDVGEFKIVAKRDLSEEMLKKITLDPESKTSKKLFVLSDHKVNGKFEIYNITINNGNESHRRQVLATKKLMATKEAKKILN